MSSNFDEWNAILYDKVVFLTGAAGGVARYIAEACYVHGASVVLGDLDVNVINKIKDEIIAKTNIKEDRLLVVKLDVTDEKSIQRAIQTTLDKWETIHVLLNTAATYVLGNVEEVSAEDWSRLFDTNVRGYALMAKHIAPIMKKQNSGSIVNMASISGLIASPDWVPYSATKGAIIQLTRNLALDLGPFNIRVNTVSPSAIDTPATFAIGDSRGINKKELEKACKGKCLKRLCSPEEVGNLFVFLASDLCQFMTGANLVLDGGTTIV